MKKITLFLVFLFLLGTIFSSAAVSAQDEELTFGYITPGPDTWYKRDVEGFQWACELLGVETIVMNSQYDVGTEVSNIESMLAQGVDGMAIFSFNQQGAITAADKANDENVPLVTVDNVGQALETEHDITAAIDFDWAGMGVNYAEYMAENYPGDKIAIIAGLLSHRPVQVINEAMRNRVKELGKNEIVTMREGAYDPSVAVNEVQDLIQSGVEFDILWVMNEDMAAAVIRYLDSQDLLDEYTVIAQNGSPVGIPLVRQGKLDYTISSSPGWEGMVSALALYHRVIGNTDEINKQIMLPVIPVTQETINDKTKVVPWKADRVWIELTKEYFPELGQYLPEADEAELPE
jgi:ribose transport system substrate-binding protein